MFVSGGLLLLLNSKIVSVISPTTPVSASSLSDNAPAHTSRQSGAHYALALGTSAVGTEMFMIAALLATITGSVSVGF